MATELTRRCSPVVLPALIGSMAVLVVLAASVRRATAQADRVLLSIDLPDHPGEGAKVFKEKGCASCHGIGGRGPATGPDLGRVTFFGDVLDLAGSFWNHAPVMRKAIETRKIERPTLSGSEAADLVAFLTAFRYYDSMIRETGNPALGRNVFVKKGCAGCHEASAGQTAIGPSLAAYRGHEAPITIAQALWAHSPAMTAVMQARGVPRPTFQGREMTDLVAYLQSGLSATSPEPPIFELGNPKAGRDLFANKGCNTCHSIAGAGGGKNAPDLGARGRTMARSVAEIAGLMWNHSQQMDAEFKRLNMARPTFSGQEMADVISYLYFVNYASVPGSPSRGDRLFTDKCSSCHKFGQQSVGPDLLAIPGLDQPIGIIASMWNHATAKEQATARQGVIWPRLEQGDSVDLAAFIISRRAAKP